MRRPTPAGIAAPAGLFSAAASEWLPLPAGPDCPR
jgi:hypothetical protein